MKANRCLCGKIERKSFSNALNIEDASIKKNGRDQRRFALIRIDDSKQSHRRHCQKKADTFVSVLSVKVQ